MASLLIIDDDPNILDSLRDILEDVGYEVVTVTNGSLGYEQVSLRPFHLIIIDYQLPDGSGLEWAQRIHMTHPEIPLVLMTGLSAGDLDEDIPGGEHPRGIEHVLTKPISPSSLIELIRNIVD